MLWSITGISGNFRHLRNAVCSEHTEILWIAPICMLTAYGEVDARELHFWPADKAVILILGPAVRSFGDKKMEKKRDRSNQIRRRSRRKASRTTLAALDPILRFRVGGHRKRGQGPWDGSRRTRAIWSTLRLRRVNSRHLGLVEYQPFRNHFWTWQALEMMAPMK